MLGSIKRRHIPRFHLFQWPVSNSKNDFSPFSLEMQSRSKCLPTHQQIGQHGNTITSATKPITQRRSFDYHPNYWQTNNNNYTTKADYLIAQSNQLYPSTSNVFSTPLDFSTMTELMSSILNPHHHQTSMETTTSTTHESLLNTPVKGMCKFHNLYSICRVYLCIGQLASLRRN